MRNQMRLCMSLYNRLCESEFSLLISRPLSEDCIEISNKQGFQIYGQDCSNGFLLKVQFTSNFPPKTFLSYLLDTKQRPIWDKNVEKIDSISLTPNVHLTYTKFKKILGVSQRDMVIISKTIENNDGILLISTSHEHPDYPQTKGITRIQIQLAGYYLQPLETGTKVFHVTHADFGGILPQRVMKNAVALSLPKFHAEMEKAMIKNSDEDYQRN
jgi:START domain